MVITAAGTIVGWAGVAAGVGVVTGAGVAAGEGAAVVAGVATGLGGVGVAGGAGVAGGFGASSIAEHAASSTTTRRLTLIFLMGASSAIRYVLEQPAGAVRLFRGPIVGHPPQTCACVDARAGPENYAWVL